MLNRFSIWLEGPISRLNQTSGDRRWWIVFWILATLILVWILGAGIVAADLLYYHAGIMTWQEPIIPREWINVCGFITVATTPIVYIEWILARMSWKWAHSWFVLNFNIFVIHGSNLTWHQDTRRR
jgi:hypothetical protein